LQAPPASASSVVQSTGESVRVISRPQQEINPAILGATPELATKGDANAMIAMGYALFQGQGLPRNYGQAVKWFYQAAEQGDPRGWLALGLAYGDGLGTDRNPQAAREALERAVESGLIRGLYLQSRLEMKFSGATRREQARQLLQEAAQKGDGLAQNALGIEFERDGDVLFAEQWYRLGAENGSRAAGLNVNRLYRKNRFSQQTDIANLRARQDDPTAAYELAQRYHRGDGVPIDFGTALRFYRKAANLGSRAANQMLALIQSKPAAKGESVNAQWMQQLARNWVQRETESSASSNGPPVQDDDLLRGLPTMRSSLKPSRR
jgi:uncharacterized protein